MKVSRLIPAVLLGAVLCIAAGQPGQQSTGAQTPFKLTNADLGVMLKDLKYETATTKDGQLEIEMKQGTYSFHPFVAVSTSGNKVWITTSVRPLSANDMANAEFLGKLLQANTTIGPAQFYIENLGDDKKPDLRLGFGYPLDNRGITEEILREALDAFASNLADQATVWDKK